MQATSSTGMTNASSAQVASAIAGILGISKCLHLCCSRCLSTAKPHECLGNLIVLYGMLHKVLLYGAGSPRPHSCHMVSLLSAAGMCCIHCIDDIRTLSSYQNMHLTCERSTQRHKHNPPCSAAFAVSPTPAHADLQAAQM